MRSEQISCLRGLKFSEKTCIFIGQTELTPSWSEGLSASVTVSWIWINVKSDLNPPLEFFSHSLCSTRLNCNYFQSVWKSEKKIPIHGPDTQQCGYGEVSFLFQTSKS